MVSILNVVLTMLSIRYFRVTIISIVVSAEQTADLPLQLLYLCLLPLNDPQDILHGLALHHEPVSEPGRRMRDPEFEV